MKLFRFPLKRFSDEEYLANLRRSKALLDRYGLWLLFFNVALLVAVVWMAQSVVGVIIALNANAPAIWVGFSMGLALGIGFGVMLHGIVRSCLACLTGFRHEQLLLKYYDELKESEHLLLKYRDVFKETVSEDDA